MEKIIESKFKESSNEINKKLLSKEAVDNTISNVIHLSQQQQKHHQLQLQEQQYKNNQKQLNQNSMQASYSNYGKILKQNANISPNFNSKLIDNTNNFNLTIFNKKDDYNDNAYKNLKKLELKNQKVTLLSNLDEIKTTQKTFDWWKINPLENPWQQQSNLEKTNQKINKMVNCIPTTNDSIDLSQLKNCKKIKNKFKEKYFNNFNDDDKIILNQLKEKYGKNAR